VTEQPQLGIEGAVVLDACGEPRRTNVYVHEGAIAAVTTERLSADRILRRDDAVLIPGFANLHVHTRPGRALGDGLPMLVWHERWADGLTLRMRDGDGYSGAMLALSECLLGGTTSVVVMTPRYLEAAQAARDIGIRAIVVPLGVDLPEAAGTGDDVADSIEAITKLGRQEGERVRVWFGFDSTYSTSEDGLRAVAAAARELPLGVHTHMSEEKHDARMSLGSKGLYGAHYFEDVGLLDLPEPIVLAHCNWLEPREIELLAAAPTAIVSHNPTSNMHLGTGVCPVVELLDAGVRVGLGTDGMLSNYHLDMFEVMRGAAMLQRVTRTDAAALGSAKVLELATRGGGVFHDHAGFVEPGAPADLAVLQLGGPRFAPRVDLGEDSNLLALAVWCAGAGDVTDVVVDGRVVVENRALMTADAGAIVADADAVFDRMFRTPLL
jgi:5-methylthioadenosine/S-adenosylhomocysteine deaminase